jgi:ubiquinone/menaquinone biosynthesis C-methylase UbiE
VGETRRDPGCLLWGKEVVGGLRLHLDGALEGVLQLMEIVGMPARDQVGAVVDIRPRGHLGLAPHVDEPLVGRSGQIVGQIGSDGHGRTLYQWRMDEKPSEEEVRQSFARQVGLFSGDDSPFASRSAAATRWVEPLSDDMLVLDVACGAAHVAEEIAPHVRQVVGIDLTPDLLRLGADRLGEAGVSNVLLQEGNATDLPFLDETFALVLCRSALHHFRDPSITVREMARVCRQGGRVVVSDLVAPDAEVRAAYDDLHRKLDPSHMGVLLADELVELLADEVGPIAFAELPDPHRLPLDYIFSQVSDREAVRSALAAELDGGPPSGFEPALDPETGSFSVSFATATVQGSRLRAGR